MYELVDSHKHYTQLGEAVVALLSNLSQEGQQATLTKALFGFTYNLSRSGTKWSLVVTYGDMDMDAADGWLNLYYTKGVEGVLGPRVSITCNEVSKGMVVSNGTIHS